MTSPQESLRVRTVPATPLAELEAELAELRAPGQSPETARALLVQGSEDLQAMFDTLPKADVPTGEFETLVYFQRAPSNEVREMTFKVASNETRDGEIVHLDSSGEVYIARFPHEEGDQADFGLYSWYGMHDPCGYKITPDGTVITERGGRYETPEQEVLELVERVRSHLEYLEIDAQIVGTPAYRDESILTSLDPQSKFAISVGDKLRSLPRKILENDFYGSDETFIMSIGPYNRRDVDFYDDRGELREEALREATPEIMELYDILKNAGFEPVIEEERSDVNSVPHIGLYIPTALALSKVEI